MTEMITAIIIAAAYRGILWVGSRAPEGSRRDRLAVILGGGGGGPARPGATQRGAGGNGPARQ